MSSSGSQEHWFDRLAAGHHTRRQALGAAIAGAAALTLPFLRPALARADAGTCTKGCLYTIHYDGVAAFTACDKQSAFSDSEAFTTGYLAAGVGLLAFAAAAYQDKRGAARVLACRESVVLNAKARGYDCLQPNCPGFVPTQPGGPCETCHSQCCLDPRSADGYNCCDICSQSGGCCYSVTGMC